VVDTFDGYVACGDVAAAGFVRCHCELPNVPVRQWVASLPWELRGLAAARSRVLGAIDHIFAEEIARLTKRLAGIDGAQTGSIGCPPIFDGSLNLRRCQPPAPRLLAVDRPW
jgi:hypothetical protein